MTSDQRHVYLTPEELDVLASAISSDRGYEFAEGETDAAERLWGLGFIEVDDGMWAVAQTSGREFYEAFIQRPPVPPEEAALARRLGVQILTDADADADADADSDADSDVQTADHLQGSAGALLETVLSEFAKAGTVPVEALFPMVMRQRQNLGRQLQEYAERRHPLDLCGETAWKLAALPLSDLLKEVEGVRCGRAQTAPALVKAGLATSVDGALQLTERPERWHITQAGNLRIDGRDVASGPTLGLRALGRFLHDVGYPKVTTKQRLLFRLGRPDVPQDYLKLRAAIDAVRNSHVRPETLIAQDWISQIDAGQAPDQVELSPVTAQLIRQLALDGGKWEGAGIYLGLTADQWQAHKGVTSLPTPPGPWAMQVLRMLPAQPRVVSWVLGLEEPLGSGVALDLLRGLQGRGLANHRVVTAEWCLTPRGEATLKGERRTDPIVVWSEHQDHGDAAKLPGFRAILPALESELERRIRDADENWRVDDALRSSFVSYVLRYLSERHLGHACELAYALWSRAVSGGVCLTDNEVAFMNLAISENGVDLADHGADVGKRLESLGYVEIVDDHLARPLEAGRDATELYERPSFGWDE